MRIVIKFIVSIAILFGLNSCILDNNSEFNPQPKELSLESKISNLIDNDYAHLIIKYNLLEIQNLTESNYNYPNVSFLYFLNNKSKFSDQETQILEDSILAEIEVKTANNEKLLTQLDSNLDKKIAKMKKIILDKNIPTTSLAKQNKVLEQYLTDIKKYKSKKPLTKNLAALDEKFEILHKIDVIASSIPLNKPTSHYRVTSSYGLRIHPTKKTEQMHQGIDIVNDFDKKILASAAGIVIESINDPFYGNTLVIEHGLGYKTRYAHMSKILVKEGDYVDVMDIIGIQGKSGRSTAEHLHYEVIFEGKNKNPSHYLKLASR